MSLSGWGIHRKQEHRRKEDVYAACDEARVVVGEAQAIESRIFIGLYALLYHRHFVGGKDLFCIAFSLADLRAELVSSTEATLPSLHTYVRDPNGSVS